MIAGMEKAKRALLLLAVDPGLKGVLIAGPPGIGKTALARAFQPLVDGPWVQVPLGVTDDRLIGGLDLERTISAGARRASEGLLAAADGGFLVIDDVNLLDARQAACIASALDSGVIRVEREGVSQHTRSRFALVATYDPAAGEVHSGLRDVVGLRAYESGEMTVEERVRMLQCDFADETAAVRSLIAQARRLDVSLTSAQLEALCALGSGSHRREIAAARAARASAALDGRSVVSDADLEAAIRLCLSVSDGGQALAGAALQPRSGGSSSEQTTIPPSDTPPPHLESPAGRIASTPRRGKGDAAPAQRGRYIRAVAHRGGNIAIDATLRAAAPFQRARNANGRIRLEPDDLRFKQLEQAPGVLTIFVVDSSGSMALNRMDQAKGAAIRLLGEAYLHRDKVALVAFRGKEAELVVPPTRSPELAQRMLTSLPSGGGTPLASGLETALGVAARTGLGQPLVVVLTDGRPNVARGTAEVWTDLEEVCAEFRFKSIASAIIDTRDPFLSGGEAQRIAALLGARYTLLPRPDADSIYRTVADLRSDHA